MDQPVTRAEFNELKEQVRRMEQKTEEIKTVKVEVASADVLTRLDKLERNLDERSKTWLKTLQENYSEHKEDLKAMATKQDLANLAETLKEDFKNLLIQYLQPGGNGH